MKHRNDFNAIVISQFSNTLFKLSEYLRKRKNNPEKFESRVRRLVFRGCDLYFHVNLVGCKTAFRQKDSILKKLLKG